MSSNSIDDDGTVTGINVTPMVDIMLVLLIIFMVAGTFVSEASLKINLPKTETGDTPAAPTLSVSIDDKGEVFLKKSKTDLASLKAALTQEVAENPGVRLTLAADSKLPYQQVMSTLDVIKQAGVEHVALVADK
jgi:biopolymer transport protein ExbD